MASFSSQDVANQAIELIGGNLAPVTGQAPTFDNSAAGLALQRLYAPCVATVAKEHGWDFARNSVTLSLTGNSAPLGYSYEYAYPTFAVEIWQLTPTFPLSDPNNPLPINWSIGNTLVGGNQTKVIWTNLVNAKAVVNNAPTEATWDTGFREAVARLLASELAEALFGKPDTAAAYLNSGGAFETIAEGRQG